MADKELPYVDGGSIWHTKAENSVTVGSDLPVGLGDYLQKLEARIEALEEADSIATDRIGK